MTDQDEQRPLSRRELRLREMAAAGAVVDAAAPPTAPADEVEAAAGLSEPAFDIEIPLFDEDGRQRSRRELRELREQAIAELQAAQELAEPENHEAQAEAELQEAQADVEILAADSNDAVAAEDLTVDQAEAEVEADVADADFAALVAEPEELHPESEQEAAQALEEMLGGDESAVEPIAAETPDLEALLEAELEAGYNDNDDDVVESESGVAAPVSATAGGGYSFPDITPLDEGQSIFDDPALRVMGAAAAKVDAGTGEGRDFDDLITRAVAQEGATSTTNTSALILPVMPETDGLAGPLGETGELFITGSFDLPKSLSETGGHASLQDSIDIEPIDELSFAEAAPTGMMAPVSASRAVSARVSSGALVSEATKDKSKVPVVLIATGGVLVLGATGLIVWAAASGLFG